MAVRHKIRRKLIRNILVAFLVVLSYWIYKQLYSNYKNMQLSQLMVEALFQNKTLLAKRYAIELGLTKENLMKTEEFLVKVQKENEQLREKIKLLDQVAELEKTIGRLKEKNALLINQMSSPDREEAQKTEKEIRDLEGAQVKLDELLAEVRLVKRQIKEFKREEDQRRIEEFKALDQKKLLLGNKGFMLLNGQATPREIMLPPCSRNVKIDVQFVK